MNQNNEPNTREELYRNYRRSIENGNQDSENVANDNGQNNRFQKKKRHYGLWITGIIVILLAIGIFNVGHQVNELSNTQRQNDTTLDKIIKTQGEQIAKQKVPSNVRPQVIKIIQKTPLSEIQKAANNQALFDQIASQNQIPQEEIQKAQTEWFNANNQKLRSAIENGNLLAIYNGLKK